MRCLSPPKRALLRPRSPSLSACALLFASAAASSQPPLGKADEGLLLRGTAQFGAEAPSVWSLVSAHVSGGALKLQLVDEKGAAAGDLGISPWPYGKPQQGGLVVGLPAQRIRPGAVIVTGSKSLEPFGPVQRLVVQQRSAKLPSMIIQTRGQSGQLVVEGWRAVYADDRWEIRGDGRSDGLSNIRSNSRARKPNDSRSAQSLNALQPQRLRSQGQDWCMTSYARATSQESPPLLDWILVARHGKRRCPA